MHILDPSELNVAFAELVTAYANGTLTRQQLENLKEQAVYSSRIQVEINVEKNIKIIKFRDKLKQILQSEKDAKILKIKIKDLADKLWDS